MKTLAGRPRDDQDIHGLIAARGANLDWDYCEQMARDLAQALGQDLLSQVRALRASLPN